MKPSRYTLLVIPNNEDESKSFTLSRGTLRWLAVLVILLMGGGLIVGILYGPKALHYDALEKKYNAIAQERMEVLSLMRDLNRMKQMDEMIRKTLGTELKFSPEEGLRDSDAVYIAPGFIAEEGIHVSYVENIPSVAPIQGFVTQRVDKTSLFTHKNHYGIDIAVSEGEQVLSTASGVVVFSGWTYNMGNLIILYHGDGYFTHYGHNQRNLVQQRDFVDRGQIIAMAGNTGISSGPHLHFEVWKEGRAIDPLVFFPEYNLSDVSGFSDG